ncbi:hypothetical protein QC760_010553 [Botrytis cinerea]
MGKNSQWPNKAEIRRRQEQSSRDLERNRRQQAVQARLAQALHQQSTLFIPTQPSIHVESSAMAFRSSPQGLFGGPPNPATSTQESNSNLNRVFDSLFNNSKYSDMTIYLGESKIPFASHRAILGMRCPYFDDVLQSGFKESITNEISFEKDSPHALWRVLHYIYTGDYSDEPSEILDSEGDDLELLKHPRVFALADMFRIEQLKILACEKFKKQLQQHWISDTFPDCIREVYTTSNDIDIKTIRNAVVSVVALHKKELVEKRSFQELIREIGDFAVDLVLRVTQEV